MKSLLSYLLLASMVLAGEGCAGPDYRDRSGIPLPFDVRGPRIGMTESEFARERPDAVENESVDGYSESLGGALPFASQAEYRFRSHDFLGRRRLSEIYFARFWSLNETPTEIETLVPGLLFGCRRLWGEPTRVCVTTLPLQDRAGRRPEFVNLVWERVSGVVILRYAPSTTIRRALQDMDHGVPLSIEIWITAGDGTRVRLDSLHLDDSATSVRGHFTGIPDTEPPGPVLR